MFIVLLLLSYTSLLRVCAEKADLSNNYISNIENNHSIPSLETLMMICVALEVTPNDLLLGSSTQEANYLNHDISYLLGECTATEKRYPWVYQYDFAGGSRKNLSADVAV